MITSAVKPMYVTCPDARYRPDLERASVETCIDNMFAELLTQSAR